MRDVGNTEKEKNENILFRNYGEHVVYVVSLVIYNDETMMMRMLADKYGGIWNMEDTYQHHHSLCNACDDNGRHRLLCHVQIYT